MAKPQLQQNKFSVASRTAYDLLPVESGEEDSEEESVSNPEAVVPPVVCVEIPSQFSTRAKPHTPRETPSKPSKTAIKKAAKAARQEKKQQSVTQSGGDTSERPSPAPTLPLGEPEVGLPAASDRHSVEPPESSPPKSSPPKANTNPPGEASPLAPNGHTARSDVGSPRPKSPGQSPDHPSRPQRGPPTIVDQPPRPARSPSKQAPPPSESVSSPSRNAKDLGVSTPTKPATEPEADKSAKKSHNVFVRTLWTFIMIGGFLGQFYWVYKTTC